MSFSTAIRKARDHGRRSLALALAPRRPLQPLARYRSRPHDAVLVLQKGENASTAYYLRPRLEQEQVPCAFADIDSDPRSCAILAEPGAASILVVVCRYVSSPWLRALEELEPRLARVAYFVDDDLPAMMADRRLPYAARGKVAAGYGQHVSRLERVCSEVWVSTPALARRQTAAAIILPPLPEAEPREPSSADTRLVVYHGTDSHPEEKRFCAEIARRLAAMDSEAILEITGGGGLRRSFAALTNVRVTRQLAWSDYLAQQRGREAALLLGPLSPSPINDVRAPVKVFDAARLGATGLFAASPPYAQVVRDGVDGLLLPPDPQAWAEAIVSLMQAPERRRALALVARDRLIRLRRDGGGLPPVAA